MQLSYFSKPSAATRRYVRYYVQHEAQLGTSTVAVPVPARAAHLLDFEFGSRIETRATDTDVIRRPDTAALVGLETYPRHCLLVRGNIESFAIQFQATAIHRLFGVPAVNITDCDYAAHAVLGLAVSELQQRLGNARCFEDRVQIADQFIASQGGRAPDRDSIELAANEIMRNDGRCRIDFLAHHTGLSVRNFQRMFRDRVGVPPKVYSRIVRFEAALRTKAASPHMSWMTVAHQFGYHDQMHLIHDFRQFSGETPSGILGRPVVVFSTIQSAVHVDPEISTL
jgi:AraC-like DNA-binding protein